MAYPDPDVWARTSDDLQRAIGRAIGSYAGPAVLSADTGTKTADGQMQTLAMLIAAQVGLSQAIEARLARIEQLLGAK